MLTRGTASNSVVFDCWKHISATNAYASGDGLVGRNKFFAAGFVRLFESESRLSFCMRVC